MQLFVFLHNDSLRTLLFRINPVTGCYEGPKSNPMEGISEEQKEYEALKLLHLVDELTRFVNICFTYKYSRLLLRNN